MCSRPFHDPPSLEMTVVGFEEARKNLREGSVKRTLRTSVPYLSVIPKLPKHIVRDNVGSLQQMKFGRVAEADVARDVVELHFCYLTTISLQLAMMIL